MKALSVLTLGLLSRFAVSQSATLKSAGTTATASAAATTWTVKVGQGDHTFKPNILQADVGDIIEFDFFPPNHSVVRAEYALRYHTLLDIDVNEIQIHIPLHPL